MNQYTYAAAALALALTLSCSPRDRRDAASTTDSAAADISRETREAGQDVREAAQDVREDVGSYTYERREEFRRDMGQRVQRLDEELAQLERNTQKGMDKARDSALVKARALRRSVDRSLERVRGATSATWNDIQAAVSRSVDSLDLALRNLRSDAHPMGGTGPR